MIQQRRSRLPHPSHNAGPRLRRAVSHRSQRASSAAPPRRRSRRMTPNLAAACVAGALMMAAVCGWLVNRVLPLHLNVPALLAGAAVFSLMCVLEMDGWLHLDQDDSAPPPGRDCHSQQRDQHQ